MALMIAGFSLYAQSQEAAIHTGTGFGFQLNQYQRDFGLGLNFTSPFFAHDMLAVRLRANMMYNESVQNFKSSWVSYSNASLGLVGVGGMIGEYIRLYGEGGDYWHISV